MQRRYIYLSYMVMCIFSLKAMHNGMSQVIFKKKQSSYSNTDIFFVTYDSEVAPHASTWTGFLLSEPIYCSTIKIGSVLFMGENGRVHLCQQYFTMSAVAIRKWYKNYEFHPIEDHLDFLKTYVDDISQIFGSVLDECPEIEKLLSIYTNHRKLFNLTTYGLMMHLLYVNNIGNKDVQRYYRMQSNELKLLSQALVAKPYNAVTVLTPTQ